MSTYYCDNDNQVRHMHPVEVKKRVCLVSAAGGHFAQILRAKHSLADFECYLVTVGQVQTLGQDFGCRILFVSRIVKNPVRFLVNFIQSLRIFVRMRPDIVVTTGSGEAVSTFIIARCLGRKTVFLESFARVRTPSATGRILKHFADRILVQWEPLIQTYPRARYVGPFFHQRQVGAIIPPTKILAAVGTQTRGFERLIRAVDTLGSATKGIVEIRAQIGSSQCVPTHVSWFRFFPPDEFRKQVEWADIIVTHSGAGLIGQALEFGKRIVISPRDSRRGESLWGFDAELPNQLSRLGVVKVASPDELCEILINLGEWTPNLLRSADFGGEIIRSVTL